MKHCPADTNKDGFINEKNNIKCAGYFYDAETGLYYLNARFYDPETARFIQQDSNSGDIFDPLKNNSVYGAGKWCSEFKSAVASNDWNTASYKLGVGVVNTAEVAGSIAIGGKIGGKIPTGKVSWKRTIFIGSSALLVDRFTGNPRHT